MAEPSINNEYRFALAQDNNFAVFSWFFGGIALLTFLIIVMVREWTTVAISNKLAAFLIGYPLFIMFFCLIARHLNRRVLRRMQK